MWGALEIKPVGDGCLSRWDEWTLPPSVSLRCVVGGQRISHRRCFRFRFFLCNSDKTCLLNSSNNFFPLVWIHVSALQVKVSFYQRNTRRNFLMSLQKTGSHKSNKKGQNLYFEKSKSNLWHEDVLSFVPRPDCWCALTSWVTHKGPRVCSTKRLLSFFYRDSGWDSREIFKKTVDATRVCFL